MKRFALLFLTFAGSVSAAATYTTGLDTSTSLLDSSLFTAGTDYFAAFQLTGGDHPGSVAELSGFVPAGGPFSLAVDAANNYALETLAFTAGTSFRFTAQLAGSYTGGIPDEFSFQLYDSGVTTLLYDQSLDIRSFDGVSAPEPGTLALFLVCAFGLMARRWKGPRQRPSVP